MAVRVSQALLEVVVERPTTSPASPSAGNVAVSQAVLEVVVAPEDDDSGGAPPEATTHTFGYAL